MFSLEEPLRQSLAESILALSRKEMTLMDFEYSSLIDKANANRKMASWQVTNNILLCQADSIKYSSNSSTLLT